MKNPYIKIIKIKQNSSYPGSQVLRKDLEFKAHWLNPIVGEQGCGKSTLLKMLQNHHEGLSVELSEEMKSTQVSTYYFDSETMNPRVVDPILYTNPDGTRKGIGMANAVSARFQSHGQTLVKFILDPLRSAKDCIIFLDEPESGLSIPNQFRLRDELENAHTRGCQIFLATHSAILIQGWPVFHLESNSWIDGSEYLYECRESSKLPLPQKKAPLKKKKERKI
jgi:predicted ATPase